MRDVKALDSLRKFGKLAQPPTATLFRIPRLANNRLGVFLKVEFLKALPYELPPLETPNTVQYRVKPKKE